MSPKIEARIAREPSVPGRPTIPQRHVPAEAAVTQAVRQLAERALGESSAGVASLRLGIGIGATSVSERQRAASPAARRAENALQSMPRRARLALEIPPDGHALFGTSAAVAVQLLDRTIQGWTSAQARAVLGAMDGVRQAKIAAGWPDGPISQQAVAEHLGKASWDAVASALAIFESNLRHLESLRRFVAMSPTIFRARGLRFFFFSREEARVHVHVSGAQGEAKIWLEPEIELARNHGLGPRQLKSALTLIKERQDEIREAWSRHLDG